MQQLTTTFTRTYREWQAGDAAAQEALIQLVFNDLRRIAQRLLSQEHKITSLQPTLLASETTLRLLGAPHSEWQNRQHFFLIAARQMRRLLIDHARHTLAQKRLTYPQLLPLIEADRIGCTTSTELLALNEALAEFEKIDPRASQVVELRFFFGATEKEIAAALGVSLITVKRDWETARLWLYDYLHA